MVKNLPKLVVKSGIDSGATGMVCGSGAVRIGGQGLVVRGE